MKLSIVTATKNDRMNGCLNIVLSCLEGLPVEVLVVDWGSPIPLVLPSFVKHIYVSPATAAKYNKDSNYAPNLALNVGIRRATGEYIGISGNDTVYVRDSFESFVNMLDRKDTLYGISKKKIPGACMVKSVSEIQDDMHKCTAPIDRITGAPYPFGGCGSLVMHRDIWYNIQGLEESLIYYGWSDKELALRLLMLGIKLRVVQEFSVYHITHSRMNRRRLNVATFPTTHQANDENWGLWNEPGVTII